MAETEKDFFQKLSGELIDFFTWAGESLGDPLARDGIIRDLGGAPSNVPAPKPLPGDKLDAVKAYRDASHPDAEAAISALANLAVLLDAIAGQVEAWGDSFSSGVQDLGHVLLELMASNYVRLRAPRLFLLMQGVSQLEDTTSTFGPGSNNLVNVWDSLWALLGFLWQPGKSLEQYDPGADRRPDLVAPTMDFLARVAAVTLGALDRNNDITIMQDVMTGWDGRGLDVDTTTTPLRSDVISERMTSFSFGGGTHNSSTQTGASGQMNVTTAMIHAVEGGPALFLALGGNADIEDPLTRTWTFSFKSRMDAAIALLIAFDRFEIRGPAGGNFQFSVSYSANPRLPTPEDPAPPKVAFSFPSSAGSRLDVGHLAFTLALTSNGAELLATISDAALLIESADHDSFTGEMLGKSPLRLPFNLVIGYSTSRGLVLEASRGAAAKPAPLSGSGNVGPPIIAATIPIGTAFGPVTIHEVGVRLSRGPADVPPAQMKQFTLELDTSFSAQIGPVYIRMDQLGILFIVDSGKPPEQRNLRLVDLHLGAKFRAGSR